MFGRFFLRLMGIEQKPPEPFDGQFGAFTYHVETLPKDYASIWIDLPRQRMQIEPYLQKRFDGPDKSDEFVPAQPSTTSFMRYCVWEYTPSISARTVTRSRPSRESGL